MATNIDVPIGVSSVGNTQKPSADVILGLPQSLILVPAGTVIASSADLETVLEAGTILPLAGRFFPISPIIGFEDQSTEKIVVNSGYGVPSKEKGKLPAFQFQLPAGNSWANNLMTFDSRQMDFYWTDDKGQLTGTKTTAGLKGFDSVLDVERAGAKDGANGKYNLFKVSMQKATEWENVSVMRKDDYDPTTLTGAIDLELTPVAYTTGVTVNVSVKEAISKVDVGATYETEIETPGTLIATNASTGAAVTITSVTYNSTTKLFAILLDLSADTDIVISGDTLSNLYTLMGAKYEFKDLEISIDVA